MNDKELVVSLPEQGLKAFNKLLEHGVIVTLVFVQFAVLVGVIWVVWQVGTSAFTGLDAKVAVLVKMANAQSQTAKDQADTLEDQAEAIEELEKSVSTLNDRLFWNQRRSQGATDEHSQQR